MAEAAENRKDKEEVLALLNDAVNRNDTKETLRLSAQLHELVRKLGGRLPYSPVNLTTLTLLVQFPNGECVCIYSCMNCCNRIYTLK